MSIDTVRIGDICVILNGFAFKSENYVDSGIRIIRISNVQKGYIEDSTPVFYPIDSVGLDKFMLESGDLLISLTGNVGRVAILANKFLPAALNQRVACLRMKSSKVSKGYLYHILNSDYFEQKCIQSSKGVAQKNMSTEWLKDFEIPVYDEEKQAEIVSILDSLQVIIANRRQELCQLDDLIKARFVEMFGKLEDNRYPIVRLGDYARLQGGYAFKSKDFVDGGIPLVQIGNINKDYLDWNVVNFLPEEYLNIYNEFALGKGDLVMAMTRPIIKSLDSVKIAKVAENDLPCLLNQRVGRFQIKEKLQPVFLEVLCKTDDFKDYVERMSGNSLQPNISSKQVEDYMIILPPIERQEEFATFVAQVDKSKVVIREALKKTQLLYDSLMQVYFG
ncbi:MAG: restriction endonuclease subunit S [Thermoguttaceae bacterium]|nr:restriction endonuclease subunit S [Thermoguttaceae bacterium]